MTDTSETMVERAEAAFIAALVAQEDIGVYIGEKGVRGRHQIDGFVDLRAAIRAAIAAMAVPTEAMIAAFKAERLKAVIEEVGPEYPELHFISDADAEAYLRSTLKVVVQAALTEGPQ